MKLHKGKGLFRKEFYSICSAHQHYDTNCHMCRTGVWHNIYKSKISNVIFKKVPSLWRGWFNR